MSGNSKRHIHVPILARVEGEGAMSLGIAGNAIQSLQLQIYEPPRLFEKFLEGREPQEVLDMVARICGICPVAYQMSATRALEAIAHIRPTPWIRAMRRLFYCGEWIESHSLHVHFLALPDFLGFSSAHDMAREYPDVVRRGLRLQGFGNALISLLGARSVHPVGACPGGFFRAPTPEVAADLHEKSRQALEDASALIAFLGTLPLPDNSHPFTTVSLRHPDEYPMNEGDIISSDGLCIPAEQFDDHFREFQVPWSNALHCLLDGKPYLVGPLARLNHNIDQVPEDLAEELLRAGFSFPTQNMVHSMVARAAEIALAIREAQSILAQYSLPDTPSQSCDIREGTGFGCTEAPRGLLWQTYTFRDGLVTSTRIVPPTSQNQARIEEDLRISLTRYGLDQPDSALQKYSEMLIRNYDPCISCSTHFLTLKVERT